MTACILGNAGLARRGRSRGVTALVNVVRNPIVFLWAPITLGMLGSENWALPGSSRLGAKARKKSWPGRNSFASNMGRTISFVVPGNIVDSRR